MKARRYIVALIATIAVVQLVSAATAQISPGTKAPDFTLPTVDGKTLTLTNCFSQQSTVMVMDVWATWCPPCRAEIPYLVGLQNKYKDRKDIMIVGIAIDQEKSKVTDFVKSQKINYPIALDAGAERIGSSYKIRSIPTTYVIDKKGVVRYVHTGFPTRDKTEQQNEINKIENEIKTLLAEQ